VTDVVRTENSPAEGAEQPEGTLAVSTLAVPVKSLSVNSSPFTSCSNKHSRLLTLL